MQSNISINGCMNLGASVASELSIAEQKSCLSSSVWWQIEPHSKTSSPNQQIKQNKIKWYKVESKAKNVKELCYGAQSYFSEYYLPCSRY
jgi:hypothetical protein